MASTETPKISPEDAKKLLEAALPKPEPPKGPSAEEIEKAKQTLKDAVVAENIAADFGPGRPGKKRFDLPALPTALGKVTVANGNVGEPAQTRAGKVELSYDEFHEWLYLYEGRIRQQRKDLYGEGVAQKIMASTHINSDSGQSPWSIKGDKGGQLF